MLEGLLDHLGLGRPILDHMGLGSPPGHLSLEKRRELGHLGLEA